MQADPSVVRHHVVYTGLLELLPKPDPVSRRFRVLVLTAERHVSNKPLNVVYSGVLEHGTAVGHTGPVRGGGIRAEGVQLAGRLALQGPRKPRDQPGVCAGNTGQTPRRSGPIRGRRASLQACGRHVAGLLQFPGKWTLEN